MKLELDRAWTRARRHAVNKPKAWQHPCIFPLSFLHGSYFYDPAPQITKPCSPVLSNQGNSNSPQHGGCFLHNWSPISSSKLNKSCVYVLVSSFLLRVNHKYSIQLVIWHCSSFHFWLTVNKPKAGQSWCLISL